MSDTKNCPRGIWYEEKKRRYRVRLYRNNIAYLGGYFGDYNIAVKKLAELKLKISAIPKCRRIIIKEPYTPSISGHLDAMEKAKALDPRITRTTR